MFYSRKCLLDVWQIEKHSLIPISSVLLTFRYYFSTNLISVVRQNPKYYNADQQLSREKAEESSGNRWASTGYFKTFTRFERTWKPSLSLAYKAHSEWPLNHGAAEEETYHSAKEAANHIIWGYTHHAYEVIGEKFAKQAWKL